MNDWTGTLIFCAIAIILYLTGQRWWRNRKAAKLADQLLEEVIENKDSFRR